MIIERRKFIAGLATLFSAPAIVRASSLMPVRSIQFDMDNLLVSCIERFRYGWQNPNVMPGWVDTPAQWPEIFKGSA